MDDIRVLLFLHIIQTTLMVYVGLALFNVSISKARIAACGAILGVFVWLLRGAYVMLGIPFGTHTLVMTLFFILGIRFIGRQNWGLATGATLVSMTLVLIGSGVSQLLVEGLGLTGEQIINNVWLHILMGYVETVFLLGMLFLNKVLGFTIVNFLDIE